MRQVIIKTGVANEVSICCVKLGLKSLDLPLEEGDSAHTPIDWVTDAGLSLIGKGVDGVISLVGEEIVEELGDIACTEDLVDIGEFLGVFGREVRGKDAVRHAFSP